MNGFNLSLLKKQNLQNTMLSWTGFRSFLFELEHSTSAGTPMYLPKYLYLVVLSKLLTYRNEPAPHILIAMFKLYLKYSNSQTGVLTLLGCNIGRFHDQQFQSIAGSRTWKLWIVGVVIAIFKIASYSWTLIAYSCLEKHNR